MVFYATDKMKLNALTQMWFNICDGIQIYHFAATQHRNVFSFHILINCCGLSFMSKNPVRSRHHAAPEMLSPLQARTRGAVRSGAATASETNDFPLSPLSPGCPAFSTPADLPTGFLCSRRKSEGGRTGKQASIALGRAAFYDAQMSDDNPGVGENPLVTAPSAAPPRGETDKSSAPTAKKTESSQAQPYKGGFRSAPVPPCLITRGDLRKLYTQLEARTAEALEKHIDLLRPPPTVDEESWAKTLKQLRSDIHLTVVVHGGEGEQIVARSIEPLSDDELPDRITLARFDSAAALQFINITPVNRFSVSLDFTEPPTFASYNPWTQPTLNASRIEVIGSDKTWVTGVYESIISFFRPRRRHRAWLHSQRTFNAAHWIIGFPAALWIVYRTSYYLPALRHLHPALQGAIYVYVFLASLLVFRGIIWLFRWLFPVIELAGSRPKAVRRLLSLILSWLLLSLVYDVLKAIIWHK
jgi:hypothetical protein